MPLWHHRALPEWLTSSLLRAQVPWTQASPELMAVSILQVQRQMGAAASTSLPAFDLSQPVIRHDTNPSHYSEPNLATRSPSRSNRQRSQGARCDQYRAGRPPKRGPLHEGQGWSSSVAYAERSLPQGSPSAAVARVTSPPPSAPHPGAPSGSSTRALPAKRT